MLSPEEQRTLENYREIGKTRNKKHANPNFWRLEFDKFKKLLPAGRVLDVGCGGRRDAILFAEGSFEYTGIDLSDEMLAAACELVPGADFRKMSMYALEFPEQSYDGFWAMASLIHIPRRKINLALGQIRKILKPQGVGFLAMLEGEGEKESDRFFALYGQEEFKKILEQNGFEVVEHYRDLRDQQRPPNFPIWLLYLVRLT